MKYILAPVLFLLFAGKCFSQQGPFEPIVYNYDSLIIAGEHFMSQNQRDRAQECFKFAIQTDTQRVEAFYDMGFLYAEDCHNNGYNCDRAINGLKEAKKRDSMFRNIDYNLAICYLKRKYYVEALQYMNLAIAKNNKDADYFATRRDIEMALGDKKAARKDNRKYRKILKK